MASDAIGRLLIPVSRRTARGRFGLRLPPLVMHLVSRAHTFHIPDADIDEPPEDAYVNHAHNITRFAALVQNKYLSQKGLCFLWKANNVPPTHKYRRAHSQTTPGDCLRGKGGWVDQRPEKKGLCTLHRPQSSGPFDKLHFLPEENVSDVGGSAGAGQGHKQTPSPPGSLSNSLTSPLLSGGGGGRAGS